MLHERNEFNDPSEGQQFATDCLGYVAMPYGVYPDNLSEIVDGRWSRRSSSLRSRSAEMSLYGFKLTGKLRKALDAQ